MEVSSSCKDEAQTTGPPVNSQGYGKFKVDLARCLTREIIRKLATYFEFSRKELSDLENETRPSHLMVQYLDTKCIISAKNVSRLTDALKHLKLAGVEAEVTQSFDSIAENKNSPDKEGFGKFKVDLSDFLTSDIVTRMAHILDFTMEEIDNLKSAANPAQEMMDYLDQKGLISPRDISLLKSVLKLVGVGGEIWDIINSFRPISGINTSTGVLSDIPRAQGFHEDKLHLLAEELKNVYHRRFFATNPIPFVSRFYKNLQDVFIESKLEVLDQSKPPDDPGRWISLETYHELVNRTIQKGSLVLHGEPGFGKSTLLRKLAYDWSTSSPESPLRNFDLFILIQLREFKDLTLSKAIRMLLPDDVSLTEMDISSLTSSRKLLVFIGFDGYDEYPDMLFPHSEVNKIIRKEMLSSVAVLVSSRPGCLYDMPGLSTEYCQLTGFNRNMQERYIKRVVSASETVDHDSVGFTLDKLNENPYLSALCEVPVFFVMFAHLEQEFQTSVFKTVTGFISNVEATLSSHLDSKYPDVKEVSEDHQQQIAKLACEGLRQGVLVWEESDMLKYVQPACYNKYVELGVLLRGEQVKIAATVGFHIRDKFRREKTVHFAHKIMQEFYAAHYIVQLSEIGEVETFLESLDPSDHPYLFRFACGLHPRAASAVSNYLANTCGEWLFAQLCMMEQTGGEDKILHHLSEKEIPFDRNDGHLHQKSKIQLLQAASNKKVGSYNRTELKKKMNTLLQFFGYDAEGSIIAIKGIRLTYVFDSVDLSDQVFRLSSSLCIPILDTLTRLVFYSKDLTKTAHDILDMSSRCKALQSVEFKGKCIIPLNFHNRDVLAKLHDQGCKVHWLPMTYKKQFSLNFQSGMWQDTAKGTKMDSKLYNLILQSLRSPVKLKAVSKSSVSNKSPSQRPLF